MTRDPGTAGPAPALQKTLTAAVEHIRAGRLEAAAAVLEAGGGAALRNPVGRNIHGDILLKQGRHRDALRDFDAALKLAPSFPEAHCNRGVALHALKQLGEALAAEDRALAYRPNYATAHFNRGNILRDLRRYGDAVAAYSQALRAQPQFPEALLNRGNALASDGKQLQAIDDFRRAVAQRSSYAAAHLAAAAVHQQLGQFADARAAIEAALAIDPLHHDALLAKNRLLVAIGEFEEALAAADAMAALDATNLAGPIARAIALGRLRRPEEALAAADEAVRLAPASGEAHTVRATVLGDLGRTEEQWQALATAGRLGADDHLFHHTRATMLGEAGQLHEAVAAYDRAIAIEPQNPASHFHKALVQLAVGDFGAGWVSHEWRLRMADYARADLLRLAPQWRGEDIAGKKLLLHSEQGHGDTIQFARYVPLALAKGARVTFIVREALRRLFVESFPGIDVTESIGLRGGFDYQSPLMSLPTAFDTRLETIPANVPYLAADPERVTKWRERIGREGFRVGIAWQGNPAYRGDRHRSIPLARFAPLAEIPGVRLISLQASQGLDQLEQLPDGMRVETLGAEITDNPDGFREVAAVMANLDLLVTSDTGPAHLAGALGRPIWVALRDRPDWRWLTGRSDSPWYPTMRLFRQTDRGDWEGVFVALAEALAAKVAGGAGR